MTQRTTIAEPPQEVRPLAEPHGAAIPPPTAWPVTLALGVTLLAGGLVMNFWVVLGGAVMTVWGTHGWVRDLMTDAQGSTENAGAGHESGRR